MFHPAVCCLLAFLINFVAHFNVKTHFMRTKISKFLRVFTTLLFAGFLAVSSFAQGQYKYVTVPNDPMNTRIYTLANGLTVYMTVYKDAPRIQTYIATKAGSKNDPADATGLAHYFEHMMFKGTSKFGTTDFTKEGPIIASIDSMFEVYRLVPPSETAKRDYLYHIIDSLSTEASKYAIPNEYDKMMAIIGATGTNAYTSLEQTVYVEEIPSNQLENWLTIESNRFTDPVLRLFHTELETIYEEKNMTLARDEVKIYFAILAGLFKNHTYGTQTVVGTTEHLKSPSMKRIREDFAEYYVPNNMAICLSGDLDCDKTIALIDKYWGQVPYKEVKPFTFKPEEEMKEPIIKEIVGPDAESVTIAYRLDGANSPDADLLSIFDMILANSMAGLIDLNLVQKQKVLSASSYSEIMKDYSLEGLSGKPKEGQTLEEVKDLLLSQIDLIKKGDFPDWLIPAIVADLKLKQMKALEKNDSRANEFVEAFILGIPWDQYVNKYDRYAKITKQEIVDFANKRFANNYIIIYKKTGKDESVDKIKKPKMTKININRDDKSDFLKNIEASKVPDIDPKFLNYKTDIAFSSIGKNVPMWYLQNKENATFNLYYIYNMGTNNDLKLAYAIEYLKFLGTKEFNPEQIKQEFFKIGCTYDVNVSDDEVWVSLSGLSENMEKGVKLFESLLADPQSNPEALTNLVKDKLKERTDAKLNQQTIFGHLVMYGIYGPLNQTTHILSEKELNALTPEELTGKIKDLNSYQHKILYYGSQGEKNVQEILTKMHNIPATLKEPPTPIKFTELPTDKNAVYQVDFDMKQAQILMLSQGGLYSPQLEPVLSLYNQYFGGSMNSIVFQELRESRALAYAAMSFYQNILGKKENHYYNISFIMTQNDKIKDAMDAFLGLLNEMPVSEKSFDLAKSSLIQSMRTERITKSDILFNYENAQKLGLDYDIRQNIWEAIPKLTFDDVKKFQEQYVKGKAQTTLVIGNKKLLDFKVLGKYGKVKKMKLEEIFGY
jgi:predicted Zn-dependent peptidase